MKTLLLAVFIALSPFHPVHSIEAAETQMPDCKHWEMMWEALQPKDVSQSKHEILKLLALYPGPKPRADLSPLAHETRQQTLTRLMSNNTACAIFAHFEAEKAFLRASLTEPDVHAFRALLAQDVEKEQLAHGDLITFGISIRTLQSLAEQKRLILNQAEEFELARIWSETKQVANLVHFELDFECSDKTNCTSQTIDHELKRIRFQAAENDRLYDELKQWIKQVRLDS